VAGKPTERAVLEIPLGEIVVSPSRLRKPTPAKIEAIAGSIEAIGQLTPIEVCRLPGREDWLLVSGATRLAAKRKLGELTIDAIQVSADAEEREQREIGENLFRTELTPWERARHVARIYDKAMKTLAEKGQKIKALNALKRHDPIEVKRFFDANPIIGLAYNWSDEAANAIGLGRADLYAHLQIAHSIHPDIVAKIDEALNAAGRVELADFSKLTLDQQNAAAAMIAGGEMGSIAAALAILLKKIAIDPGDKAASAFSGGWDRMSDERRARALRDFREQAKATGWIVTYKRAKSR